ncbi:Strictosidine synthase [Quillaja saponaria]|uniref:Strictosidine synthase n=1 Tax=Quillaja saponaria TaxID=32244 RepID=A0AAD7L7X1_QUISA|nr:Strictosidine synthase [Quillaja saponaria]
MAESETGSKPAHSPSTNSPSTRRRKSSWNLTVSFSVLVPIVLAAVVYKLEPFEPAHFPEHELSSHILTVPARNEHMLTGSEQLGLGQVSGPEDLIYDAASRVVYTGCVDGWIKRVWIGESVNDSVVEDWVNTGGRPLGLAFWSNGEVLVADPYKGLLKVTKDGEIEVLTVEADGVKFKFVDGVDVAKDGMIYFTDVSYKYSFHDFIFDILEGKPHGRFVSYNPTTKQTTVLVRDLYFANGVVVSPDQSHVIFCETVMRRCRKYYIQGPKKGSTENFIENLPGMPDNIHYDGEGHYWIAISSSITSFWDLALRYPFIRKITAIIEKYAGRPSMEKNGGVLAVDLEGKPVAHYYDLRLSLISSGIKIGDHIYCGSLHLPYIIRLNVKQYPAQLTSTT